MITTRLSFGSLDAAFIADTVPATAGLIKSSGFSTFQWNGEAVWRIALRVSLCLTTSEGYTYSTPLTASSKAFS